MWLFIASEVMLFGGLLSAYVLLREGSVAWPRGVAMLPLPLGIVSTALIVAASVVVTRAGRSSNHIRLTMWIVAALGIAFLGVRGFECGVELQLDHTPSTDNVWAVYYLLTGVHALHVVGGVMLSAWLAGFGSSQRPDGDELAQQTSAAARYWQFIGVAWLCLFVALYLL